MTFFERQRELAWATSSPANMALFWQRCRDDIVYFCNTCCWTLNPKPIERPGYPKPPKDLPFLLFPRQVEYLRFKIEAMQAQADTATEKSREVGASWLEVLIDFWGWIFEPGYRAHYGSRKLEYVDQTGNMNALLPKFDYMFNHLPDFMKQDIIAAGYNGRLPYRAINKIENPVNGAMITGEAGTESFGVGGRGGRAVLDELPQWEKAKAGWTNCGETVGSRHGLGTPNGREQLWALIHPDEAAAHFALSADEVERPMVFRIHWKDDPRKNRFIYLTQEGVDWYNRNKINLLNDNIALRQGRHTFFFEELIPEEYIVGNGRQESGFLKGLYKGWHGYAPDDTIILGRGYDDGEGRIIGEAERRPLTERPEGGVSPLWPWYEWRGRKYDKVTRAQQLDIDYGGSVKGPVYKEQMRFIEKGVFARNRDYKLYVGADPGRGDDCALIWMQWNPKFCRYEVVDYYECSGKSAYYYIPFLTARKDDWQHAEKEGLDNAGRAFLERHQGQIWTPVSVYPEPSARQKTMNSLYSVVDIWRKASRDAAPRGVEQLFYVTYNDKYKDFKTRIDNARRILLTGLGVDTVRSGRWLAVMEGIRWPDSAGQNATTESNGYVHTDSHGAAAFESVCCHDPHRNDEAVDAERPQDRRELVRQAMRQSMATANRRPVSVRGKMGGYGGG